MRFLFDEYLQEHCTDGQSRSIGLNYKQCFKIWRRENQCTSFSCITQCEDIIRLYTLRQLHSDRCRGMQAGRLLRKSFNKRLIMICESQQAKKLCLRFRFEPMCSHRDLFWIHYDTHFVDNEHEQGYTFQSREVVFISSFIPCWRKVYEISRTCQVRSSNVLKKIAMLSRYTLTRCTTQKIWSIIFWKFERPFISSNAMV